MRIETHPDPQPGPTEIVVETRAIGVNFADCVIRMGLYSSAKKYVGWPITPGFEFSGIVHAVGDKVTSFKRGDDVFGVTRFGAYASHVSVEERLIRRKPKSLTLEQSGAFPVVFMTAYYAMHELVHPYAGDSILVHSAAGGVGSALVQLGKLAGATVVGVVGSTHKVNSVVDLGADHVIDKSQQNLWDETKRLAPDGYAAIYDGNGAETLRQGFEQLAPMGKLVIYGFHSMFSRNRGTPNWLKLGWDYLRTPRFNPLTLTDQNKSVLAFNLSYLFDRLDRLEIAMNQILSWIDAGKLRMPTIKSYPFEQVANAHRDLESAQTVGKLILVP